MEFNSKQRKVLKLIFTNPVPADILWKDIESLLKALAAEVTQGQGSRVRVKLDGIRAVFHEPHPEKETNRGAVKSVREFLLKAGVEVEKEIEDIEDINSSEDK
uniref:type II toxin-antitoxin system HicA family toxin n=1 Tax=Calothrix sp. PCC 6303 TaxID=1170562 RepID=UPI000A02C1A7|nr:type II toxin-antitoxin system HicA family toxin [Calothrix sp. PCC 6303]